MQAVSKAFEGVPALKGVDFDLARGEVHALMGENGAGKSTLMKILAGICRPDAGSICLNGRQVEVDSPKDALRLGISMIHQELNPVREMTVAENIFLGREPCIRFTNIVDVSRQREMARVLLREFGVSIDPDLKMRSLTIAQTQMVEMAKAVSANAGIIIMDEPTSAITGREVARLFEIIAGLKGRGISVIYISHKLDEVFRVADRITVLRDGQRVATVPTGGIDHDGLVRLMVGRQIDELYARQAAVKGETSIEVRGLERAGDFHDITFQAKKGEVLGFAGLMGAGRSEIMETLFGLRKADGGTVVINGKTAQIRRPADAIARGMAFITEDRQGSGLNLRGSVKVNITLASLKEFCRFGQLLRFKKENAAADRQIEKWRIKTNRRDQPVTTLSGGNQQKVVLARWLLKEPEIIILDEPTRGIDIGAKAEIYRIIGDAARRGKTILLASSELPELMGLCDRVLVIRGGRISAELERREFSEERIVRAAMPASSVN